jgi:E3 ubiquitin-protein ligase ZSWIM2
MSRLQPYRNRIPTHIIKLLDVSSRITLFLVGQNGPLSFIFKDRLENKYKTTIGADIKCSCTLNKNDHCIHSLYVLLKIFKISVDNPIIWQAAYIDSELSDIVAGKHTVAPVRQRINRPIFSTDEVYEQ